MVIDCTDVAVDRDDPDVIVVGFRSERARAEHYVILQRSREFDEQDIALGMDAVYIERDDQSYASYGGITEHVLLRDRLTLRLNEDAAANLDCDPEIELRFALDDGRFAGLKAALDDIFDAV